MRNTIDPQYYEIEKGSSWPTWEDFLNGAVTDNKGVNAEIESFVIRYAYTLTIDQKDFNVDNHVLDVFPPLFYKLTYPFNYERLKPLVDAYVSLSVVPQAQRDISGLDFDYGDEPHTWPEMQGFIGFINQAMEQIKQRNLISESNHKITNSWLVKSSDGGMTSEHNHVQNTFSVVSYISAPEGAGKLVLRDPLEYHKAIYPFPKDSPENAMKREVEVRTNDVIVFPGFMYHSTTQHFNKIGDRVSFVVNINCDPHWVNDDNDDNETEMNPPRLRFIT